MLQKCLQNINVSLGTLLNVKPFFVTYATLREMILCLCKLCLNTRLLFNEVREEVERSSDYSTSSAYFRNTANCPRSENGYSLLRCCCGKCINCKDTNAPQLLNE